jgi:tetratricopeptide (TPR) repeat protein
LDRYPSAAELATDLQAVADDLPLSHAREPWSSRIAGGLRRNRRRLTTAAVVLVAITVALAAGFSFLVDRAEYAKLVQLQYEKAMSSFHGDDFASAKKQFEATVDLVNHFAKPDLRTYLTRWRNFPAFVKTVQHKLKELYLEVDLEELKDLARAKSKLADRIDQTRNAADAYFAAAERLRFRLLLGKGSELDDASRDLQAAFQPFYVLKAHDWTKLDHIQNLLDDATRERLRLEVNELLFLWMATLDESLSAAGDSHDAAVPKARESVAKAIAICEHVLTFAEPQAPWRALKARLEALQRGDGHAPASPVQGGGLDFVGEPQLVAEERSPLACFQWALLCSRAGRTARAIEWMRQAARHKWNDYWYQFFLAYLEDQANLADRAQEHYSVAVALRPDSPWIRFNRARFYRSRGQWSQAVDDLKTVLHEVDGQPEDRRIRLELGYVFQELGDFAGARGEYDRVIASNNTDRVARAARLNRANVDVESGAIERARTEYDALLALDGRDSAARQSRALLELRFNHAERAEADLTFLLESAPPAGKRNEYLGARALARLLSGRRAQALADVTEAMDLHPCPAHERLRQRVLLAAHRFDQLELDNPEMLRLLPLAGTRLDADLRAASDGLARLAAEQAQAAYRACLNRAVILAALRLYDPAIADATRAIRLSPFSPGAYLIRGRVRAAAGDRRGARDDVERGLTIQSNLPGLLELRGSLRNAAGDSTGAIQDFDKAIAWGAVDHRVHSQKALALVALRAYPAAVREWSLALRRDPELPEAYLGRARANLHLREWDLALADLEQAASWAHADPGIELGILTAYVGCLQGRPDRLPRCSVLAQRTALDVWSALAARAPGPGRSN